MVLFWYEYQYTLILRSNDSLLIWISIHTYFEIKWFSFDMNINTHLSSDSISSDSIFQWSNNQIFQWSDDSIIEWSGIPMIRWFIDQVIWHSNYPIIQQSSYLMFRYSTITVIKLSNIQMIRCSDGQIIWQPNDIVIR